MIHEDIIRRWWEVFKDGNELVEIRILGSTRENYSGYYKNIDKLVADVSLFGENTESQIYWTLNSIDDGCYGRVQSEHLVKSPKTTTTDSNIIRRKWVLIDLDPVRVAGVNANEEEFERAHKKAGEVFRYLISNGFHKPVVCKSGNGWHLLLKVDLPNDDETTGIIKGFLQGMSLVFSDSEVDIDESVFNAARICKLYGTMARKGANKEDRPWRLAEIVYVPDEIEINDISLFRNIADMVPKEEPRVVYSGHVSQSGPFDVEKFLADHGVGYKRVRTTKFTKYVLDHCLFNPDHKAPDAAIIQQDSGGLSYTCLHNSCRHHTWKDARLLLDPTAYQHEYRPISFAPQRQPYAPPPSLPAPLQLAIQEEVVEKGPKWLTFKDIKKIDLEEIEHVKTGFTNLDNRIKGLFMGTYCVVSGLNSSGKSSWLNTLLLNIIDQDYKAALWSGELPPYLLKTWIQLAAAGGKHLATSPKGYYYVPNDVAGMIDEWISDRLFIYNHEYGYKWEQIFSDMEELRKKGVKVFVLDNLMGLDIDIFGSEQNASQKRLVKQIDEFCKENMVHVILVAHPRKTVQLMRKVDISGTSDITNMACYVFIVHRVNNDFRRVGAECFGAARMAQIEKKGYGNVIEVAKDRYEGVQDFLCGTYFEDGSRRFKNDPNEQKEYGWYPQGEQIQMFQDDASASSNDGFPFPPPINDMPF